jgi:hypothetical protein
MQVEASKKFQSIVETHNDFSIKDAYHCEIFYAFLFDPYGRLLSIQRGESPRGESADV